MRHTEHQENQAPGARLSFWAKRLRFNMALLGIVLVVEVIGGYLSNSLALLSDAGHVLTDFVALLLAWLAVNQATRPPTPQMTYGYHRWGILAAVVNALSLGGISLFIFYEAWQRWQNPPEVNSPLMLGVGFLGLGANVVVVLYLRSGAEENLSVKAAFWHAMGDALSSVGVIVAGVIIYFTMWFWVDAAVSVLIGLIIVAGAWRLLKEGVRVLLEAPPKHIDLSAISASLSQVSGVNGVHDMHLWTLAPGFNMLSCHLTLDDVSLSQGTRVMNEAQEMLRGKYGIGHSTLQLECPGCEVNCCPVPFCPPEHAGGLDKKQKTV